MKLLMKIAVSALAMSPLLPVSALTFDVYNGDKDSFNVTSTVIYGESEAMVVDTGFTKADALRIAAKVYDSGKPLKTIFISQADPDYYFGAEVLHQLFPNAKVVTTAAVKKTIEKKLNFKVGFWGPKMGANAPVKPYIPTAIQTNGLMLDGVEIEIRGTKGILAHRPYLWIPSEKAIVGNVGIYGNVHVWMADTQSQASIDVWSQQLADMKALKPELVIPGHKTAETIQLNESLITYTQNYIEDFEQAKSKAKTSQQLIDLMLQKYSGAAAPSSLSLGAKVHMGEMKW